MKQPEEVSLHLDAVASNALKEITKYSEQNRLGSQVSLVFSLLSALLAVLLPLGLLLFSLLYHVNTAFYAVMIGVISLSVSLWSYKLLKDYKREENVMSQNLIDLESSTKAAKILLKSDIDKETRERLVESVILLLLEKRDEKLGLHLPNTSPALDTLDKEGINLSFDLEQKITDL